MARFEFRSNDLAETERYFSATWTDSHLSLPDTSRGCEVYLRGGVVGTLGFVYARYGSGLTWIPQPHRQDFVITTCLSGHARLREGDAQSTWWPGVSRAISATSELCIAGTGPLEMGTTLIGRDAVNRCLEKWLGRPLDRELQLRQTMGPEATARWSDLERHVRSLFVWSAPAAAARALEEYAANLIINLHRHTYTTALAALPRASDADLRAAWHYIQENGSRPLSLFDVASFAGCSVASLTRAFREVHGRPLSAILRETRMQALHRELAVKQPRTLDAVADDFGFASADQLRHCYASHFGSGPSAHGR